MYLGQQYLFTICGWFCYLWSHFAAGTIKGNLLTLKVLFFEKYLKPRLRKKRTKTLVILYDCDKLSFDNWKTIELPSLDRTSSSSEVHERGHRSQASHVQRHLDYWQHLTCHWIQTFLSTIRCKYSIPQIELPICLILCTLSNQTIDFFIVGTNAFVVSDLVQNASITKTKIE